MTALSVCICTSGREAELERCLRSIAAGSARPAAVYVSDDSHSHRIERLCAEHGADYAKGPARGLCANRNSVISPVETSHVSLIDDDAVFGGDFIRDAIALLPELGPREIVSGRTRERTGLVGPVRTTYLGFFTAATPDTATCIHLNANVLPRFAFDLARFDERIEYGNEDIELLAHLATHGFTIRFAAQLVNTHLPPNDARVRAERRRQEGRARYYVSLRLRAYRHARPRAAQTAYTAIAAAHALAHAAKTGGSLRAPCEDMAQAWRWLGNSSAGSQSRFSRPGSWAGHDREVRMEATSGDAPAG
jgi:hypothetical protein